MTTQKFNETLVSIQEINKTLEERITSVRETQQSIVKDWVDEFIFGKYPHIQSISLKAYTPGFNDGDPCEPYYFLPEFINGHDEAGDQMDTDDLEDDEAPLIISETAHTIFIAKEKLHYNERRAIINDNFFGLENILLLKSLEHFYDSIFGHNTQVHFVRGNQIIVKDCDCDY